MNPQNENQNENEVNGGKNDAAGENIVENSTENSVEYSETAMAVERRPVIKDEKTVSDEITDYVFSNRSNHKHKKKVKRYHHHHHHHHDHNHDHEQERVEEQKKNRKRFIKKVVLGIVCSLLALILIAVGSGIFMMINGENQLLTNDYNITVPDFAETQGNGKFIYYNGHTYSMKENLINFLFLGIDKENINLQKETGTQGQADVIILASFDTKTRKTTMLNIPRDTMTDVTVLTPDGLYVGMKNQQICLSYAYGNGKDQSCENTLHAVQRIFYNLPISTYFSLDLDGLEYVNDSIGGVDVTSPQTIGEFVAGQSYHLMGKQAESFVRTRGDEAYANLQRNERQKIYMQSFMNTVISQTKKDIFTPLNLFNSTAPYSCTNLNLSKVTYLTKEIITGGSVQFEINNIPVYFTVNNDSVENYILEKEFFEQFLTVFYDMVS